MAEGTLKIKAETQEAQSRIDALSDSSERAGNRMQGFGRAAGAAGLALGAAVAVAGSLAAGLKALGDAAVEGDKDFQRLDRTLRNLDAGFDSTSLEVDEFFNSLQASTNFSGGEAAQAMETLTRRLSHYNIGQEQATAATRLAADVAEQMGTGIEQASTLVAQAIDGQSGAMRRLGVEGASTNERIQALQATFAGAASDISDYEQSSSRLINAKDDLIRMLGRNVIQNEAISRTVGNVARIIELLTGVVDKNNEEYAEMRQELSRLLPLLNSTGSSLSSVARAAGVLVRAGVFAVNVFRTFQIAFVALRTVVAQAARGILLLTSVLTDGLLWVVRSTTQELSGFISTLADISSVIPGMSGVSDSFASISSRVNGAAGSVEDIRRSVRGLRDELVNDISTANDRASNTIGGLANSMATSADAARRFGEGLAEAAGEMDEFSNAADPAGFELVERQLTDTASEGASDRIDVERREQEERQRIRERGLARYEAMRRRSLSEEQRRQETLNRLGFESMNHEINLEEERGEILRALKGVETEEERARLLQRQEDLQEFHQWQLEAEEAQAAALMAIDADMKAKQAEEERRIVENTRRANAEREEQAMKTAGMMSSAFERMADEGIASALRMVGSSMRAEGIQNIMRGAAMSILGNPQGPALAAQGGAQVAAGQGMMSTAGSGGGGGRPSAPSSGHSSGSTTNNTTTVNMNVGMMGGDPREMERSVTRSVEGGKRRGVR